MMQALCPLAQQSLHSRRTHIMLPVSVCRVPFIYASHCYSAQQFYGMVCFLSVGCSDVDSTSPMLQRSQQGKDFVLQNAFFGGFIVLVFPLPLLIINIYIMPRYTTSFYICYPRAPSWIYSSSWRWGFLSVNSHYTCLWHAFACYSITPSNCTANLSRASNVRGIGNSKSLLLWCTSSF